MFTNSLMGFGSSSSTKQTPHDHSRGRKEEKEIDSGFVRSGKGGLDVARRRRRRRRRQFAKLWKAKLVGGEPI